MCDHDDELVPGNLLEKLHDLYARRGVESAGGLVSKDNVGVVYKSSCDGDTLHLSAGELIRFFLKLIAETYVLKSFDGAAASLGL